MRLNKVIGVTLYRRPDYTKRVLDALAECYGIEDYFVYFSQDWNEDYQAGCDKVFDLVSHWNASEYTYSLNSPRLGIDVHKLELMPRLLTKSDYVIMLEDDIVPAKDFLRFHEWAAERFHYDHSFLSVSGYSRYTHEEISLGDAASYVGFNTWGWGMWRDRWEQYMDDESRYRAYAGDLVNGKFDWYFTDVAGKYNLNTVYPLVARCQNIGALEGEHTVEAEFMQNDYNPHGAWEYKLDAARREWRFM